MGNNKKYHYQRFEEYFRGLEDESKFRLISKKAADVAKCHAKMKKASEIELNTNIARKGVRGGKACKLQANSMTATDEFIDSFQMLRFMVKIIDADFNF